MFGKRIMELRKSQGLTQAELAKSIGISRSALSLYEIEKREPDIDTLNKFASFFGRSVDYLLGISDFEIDKSDLEWRCPPVKNRFGNILSNYRQSNHLRTREFATNIGISEDLERELEIGAHSPSMDLIKRIAAVTGYEIDYLVGATEISHFRNPGSGKIELIGSFDFRSRFEEICLKQNIYDGNSEQTLGITHEEFINITSNRMPTLSELLRISYATGYSIDYLVGKTDVPFSSLAKDELDLILNYRDCIEPYKKNIRERAEKLSIESIQSVAADGPLKQAK